MRTMLVVLLCILPVFAYAQPSIVFDSEQHDFGMISGSDTIEHIFEFTNKGDTELIIENVNAS
jgi:hypothetical protein